MDLKYKDYAKSQGKFFQSLRGEGFQIVTAMSERPKFFLNV